jgi:hypothetical protein
MEEAHEKVRQNTRTAMLRQKRYHDLKLSWQKFENGDETYGPSIELSSLRSDCSNGKLSTTNS